MKRNRRIRFIFEFDVKKYDKYDHRASNLYHAFLLQFKESFPEAKIGITSVQEGDIKTFGKISYDFFTEKEN